MENIETCLWCKKKISEDAEFEGHQRLIKEVGEAFHYYVGGKEISKEHFDAIVNRGYVIPEEMDKDRI